MAPLVAAGATAPEMGSIVKSYRAWKFRPRRTNICPGSEASCGVVASSWNPSRAPKRLRYPFILLRARHVISVSSDARKYRISGRLPIGVLRHLLRDKP
jgi:hypothetical protein